MKKPPARQPGVFLPESGGENQPASFDQSISYSLSPGL